MGTTLQESRLQGNVLLKEALSHVVWIGGATDSGKTTVAKGLAERHQWLPYHYDKYSISHHEQLAKDTAVYLPFYSNASLDERWLDPTPDTLVANTLQTFTLCFPLVIDDLLALPKDRTIIAEGFGLLPEMLAPLLSSSFQAVWLVSTNDFKWASMARRGKPSFAAKTSDPAKAKMSLFSRDILLAAHIKQQVKECEYQIYEVDGMCLIEEMTNLLDDYFAHHLTTADQPLYSPFPTTPELLDRNQSLWI